MTDLKVVPFPSPTAVATQELDRVLNLLKEWREQERLQRLIVVALIDKDTYRYEINSTISVSELAFGIALLQHHLNNALSRQMDAVSDPQVS